MEATEQLKIRRSALLATGRRILDQVKRENRAPRPGEITDLEGIEAKIADLNRSMRLSEAFYSPQAGELTGSGMARMAMYLAGARGNYNSAIEIATANGDFEVARAMNVSSGVGGGFAVPTPLAQTVVQSLKAKVAVRALGARVIPMDHGNFSLARANSSASVGYVAEGVLLVASQPQLGLLQLSSKKMVGLVGASNSLLRSNPAIAQQLIERDLVETCAAVEDLQFLRGDGMSNTPCGIRNRALPANLIASSVTDLNAALATPDTLIQEIEDDLAAMELALTSKGVKMRSPGWVLSPRTESFLKGLRGSTSQRAFPEMSQAGKLRGIPYAATGNMPVTLNGGTQTEMILADFDSVVIGEATFVIDAATNAHWTDAGNVQFNAFSADQTVIRIINAHDIAVEHPEAVAVCTAVLF